MQLPDPLVEYLPGGHLNGQETTLAGPPAQPASIGLQTPEAEDEYCPVGHALQALEPYVNFVNFRN